MPQKFTEHYSICFSTDFAGPTVVPWLRLRIVPDFSQQFRLRCWEFLRNLRTKAGEWCRMVSHGVAWCRMVSHGVAWCRMVSHGVAWCRMVSHGVTGNKWNWGMVVSQQWFLLAHRNLSALPLPLLALCHALAPFHWDPSSGCLLIDFLQFQWTWDACSDPSLVVAGEHMQWKVYSHVVNHLSNLIKQSWLK